METILKLTSIYMLTRDTCYPYLAIKIRYALLS